MWEVYSGTRPGKPARLLILSAVLLASTLGLAWWQVSASRALAAEQRVENTPLVVRPPIGWIANPKAPGRFVLPTRQQGIGRQRISIERQITFSYAQGSSFRSPREWIRERAQRDALPFSDYRPARIGRFWGVQATRRLRVEHRGFGFDQDSVIRVACTPRGDILVVEYVPLTDLTLGDLDLLDAICRAVRVDDEAVAKSPAEAWAQVGLAARLPADACVVAAREEFAGLHVGFLENGEMTHAIDIFRTWMAPGRNAAEILRDVAASTLHAPWVDLPTPDELHRADGLSMAIMPNPAVEQDDTFSSAGLVWRDPRNAVLLIARANPRNAAQAESSLKRLAEAIAFREADCAPDVDASISAGMALSKLLTQQGPVAWWGRELSRDYLLESRTGLRLQVMERSAESRNPRLGYRGQNLTIFPQGHESERWTMDEHGYEYSNAWQGESADGTPTSLRTKRGLDGTIQHTIQLGRLNRTVKLIPTDCFISPPMEMIAQAWAANQDDGEWLLETIGPWGQSLPTMRLRPLPPDADGRRRVACQWDWQPNGRIITFNVDQSVAEVDSHDVKLVAVDRARAERAIPAIRGFLGSR
ncbi:MAG: hypothetical protein JNG88_07265 [Phycisphaerales bacterium]|nr:hypothetical protein [Phycisphaerales bacterium]